MYNKLKQIADRLLNEAGLLDKLATERVLANPLDERCEASYIRDAAERCFSAARELRRIAAQRSD